MARAAAAGARFRVVSLRRPGIPADEDQSQAPEVEQADLALRAAGGCEVQGEDLKRATR